MPRFEPKFFGRPLVWALVPFAVAILAVLYGITTGHVHAQRVPAALSPFALVAKPPPAAIAAFSDSAGKRHSLSEFRGHYVLLNVWATWCAPCVKELPALARLKAEVPGLVVLAVDWGHDAPAAAAFLKEHKVGVLGSYIDGDGALARAFHAYGLPLTVLVDPAGNEIGRAEGAASWDAPESIAYFKSLTAHADR